MALTDLGIKTLKPRAARCMVSDGRETSLDISQTGQWPSSRDAPTGCLPFLTSQAILQGRHLSPNREKNREAVRSPKEPVSKYLPVLAKAFGNAEPAPVYRLSRVRRHPISSTVAGCTIT